MVRVRLLTAFLLACCLANVLSIRVTKSNSRDAQKRVVAGDEVEENEEAVQQADDEEDEEPDRDDPDEVFPEYEEHGGPLPGLEDEALASLVEIPRGMLFAKGGAALSHESVRLQTLPGQNPDCYLHWKPTSPSSVDLKIDGNCGPLDKLKVAFRLWRQGHMLAEGTPNAEVARFMNISTFRSDVIHSFRAFDARNKRYVLEVYDLTQKNQKIRNVTYLYMPTDPDCEISFFSSDKLTCEPLPAELVSGSGTHRYFEVIADRSSVSRDHGGFAGASESLSKGAILDVRASQGNMVKFKKLTGHGAVEGWVKTSELQELKGSKGLADKILFVTKRAFAVEFESVLRRPNYEVLKKNPRGRWARWEKRQNKVGLLKGVLDKYFKGKKWTTALEKLKKDGMREHYQKITEAYFFPTLQECMKDVIGVNQEKPCTSHSDCGVAGYCPAGTCKPRDECTDETGTGPACQQPLGNWPWTFDASVLPLLASETARETELDGVPVEVIAPGPGDSNKEWPLRNREGFRNMGEMLTVMNWMGAQMGPSTGMHVHVNVQSKVAGGECCLDDMQIARIWVAYAKYQLVLDEFQTPSRIGNPYAVALMMGDHRIAAVYANIHDFVNGRIHHFKVLKDGTQTTEPDMCNSALGVTRDPNTLKMTGIGAAWNNTPPGSHEYQEGGKVCAAGHPYERYVAVNLHPLGKKGTIEFRRHAGTHDVERVMRWVQFTTAFVEAFKDDLSMDKYLNGTVVDGWKRLYRDQHMASIESLFRHMHDVVDREMKDYFRNRQWVTPLDGKSQCDMMQKPALKDLTVNSAYWTSPLVADAWKGDV